MDAPWAKSSCLHVPSMMGHRTRALGVERGETPARAPAPIEHILQVSDWLPPKFAAGSTGICSVASRVLQRHPGEVPNGCSMPRTPCAPVTRGTWRVPEAPGAMLMATLDEVLSRHAQRLKIEQLRLRGGRGLTDAGRRPPAVVGQVWTTARGQERHEVHDRCAPVLLPPREPAIALSRRFGAVSSDDAAAMWRSASGIWCLVLSQGDRYWLGADHQDQDLRQRPFKPKGLAGRSARTVASVGLSLLVSGGRR
jgi:hypothetical protein